MKKIEKINQTKSFLSALLASGKITQAQYDGEIKNFDQIVEKSAEWDQAKIAAYGIKPKGKGRLSYKGTDVLSKLPAERPEICIFECYDSERLICRFATDRHLNGNYEFVEGQWVLTDLFSWYQKYPVNDKNGEFGALYQAQLFAKNVRDGKKTANAPIVLAGQKITLAEKPAEKPAEKGKGKGKK